MQLDGWENFITIMTLFFLFFWDSYLLFSLFPSLWMGWERTLWERRFKISGTPYGLLRDFHPSPSAMEWRDVSKPLHEKIRMGVTLNHG
jgi:hypothetical protein